MKVNKVIVVTSDITKAFQEGALEQKFHENQCIVNILKHMDAFKDFVLDFKTQIENLHDESDIKEVKRVLHTLKGTLWSLNFKTSVNSFMIMKAV